MPKKKQTFENAMQRLEEIVSLLEKNEAPLDDSLKLFEEGVEKLTVPVDGEKNIPEDTEA